MSDTPQTTQTVVITGSTGGIGFQSAMELAKSGARIVITGRNAERGEAARTRIAEQSGNPNIELVVGDLSTRAGVQEMAKALLARVNNIDVLVNNAGYLGGEIRHNADGHEMHFAVNVVAPHDLTLALLPALESNGGARVINVTGGDKPAKVDPDNLQAEKGFKGLMTYMHSKSAMESMSIQLARELEPKGVLVNIVFPGRASTAMTSALSTAHLPGPMKLLTPLMKFMFRSDDGKSAAKAARSTIWAATTPELEGVSGAYYDTNSKLQKLHASAYDKGVQARIFATIRA